MIKLTTNKVLAIAIGMMVLADFGLLAAQANPTSLLRFSGDDSFVNLGNSAVIDLKDKGPFTLEAWVYFESLKSVNMLMTKESTTAPMNRAGLSSSYTKYSFGVRGTGTQLSAYNGSAWVNATVALSAGTWYHLAFAYDGTDLEFFLDGVSVGSSAFLIN
ncbi:MAG: LamG domain-containing protein, partial [Lentisphaerae bacterium]|nr:LamG domain-containing protein [Lentisphaerota bacterium]